MTIDPTPAHALIVVDIQQAFVEGPAPIPDAPRVVERIRRLVDAARAGDALVVQLQNDGSRGAVDEPGTAGWELFLRPVGHVNETIIRKSADDGFVDTGLGELLDRRGVRRVVICGVLSEMCVSATARGALQRGLEVLIPRDAHGTYGLEDIPARVVSRVAEHALGDEPIIVDSTDVDFIPAPR